MLELIPNGAIFRPQPPYMGGIGNLPPIYGDKFRQSSNKVPTFCYYYNVGTLLDLGYKFVWNRGFFVIFVEH